jgi:ribonuclease-3
MQKDIKTFEDATALSFADPALLRQAFTHRSYINEHRGEVQGHNERLEFLGDAVLELVATDFLYKKYPAKPEGELTSYRAALVNTVSLAETAQALSLGDYLLLSKGEAKDTGRARDVILADAFEAVVGALYLDQGYAAAEAFLTTHLFGKLDAILADRSYQDAKSRFQERAQEKKGVTPTYETLSEVGPDHDKVFTVGVYLGEREVARGQGKSKQEAEQDAAQAALTLSGW